MNLPPSEVNPTPPVPENRVAVTLKPRIKRPMVTYILLGLTLLVFGAQALSKTVSPNALDWPFILGGKINAFILKGEVWRLITPVLLHGNLLHIAFNMYALFSLGPVLERHYGHSRFLALYLIAGFTGNALSFVFSPAASLGASTAIFGLVAAEAIFIFRNKNLFGGRAQSMLINLVLIILFNLSLGFSANSGIDNLGHLGGLAGGLIFAWLAGPFYKVQPGGASGYELVDTRTRESIWWGFLLSAGLFLAMVIGRFIVG